MEWRQSIEQWPLRDAKWKSNPLYLLVGLNLSRHRAQPHSIACTEQDVAPNPVL